jgi:hypothetical protein
MGVGVRHAWGMTEMSPIGTLATLKPPFAELAGEERLDILQTQGYPPFGVEMKITDDAGKDLPWDGKTFGRLKVAGPRSPRPISGRYRDPRRRRLFDTGDVATIDSTAICGSPTAPRTSSSPAANGFRRSIWKISRSPTRGRGSGGDRRLSSEMGRAAASDRPAQAGPERDTRGHPEIHGWQDREMVDARRRRLRRGHSAHRDRQDPENALRDQFKSYRFPNAAA